MTTPVADATAPRDIVDTVAKPSTVVPLTLVDRCDRCLAQAFVRVSILAEPGPTDLLFCRHHYLKHEPALIGRESVLSIQDETHKINERASASSA